MAPLKLRHAGEPPGGVVKRQILTQQLWGGAWESAFLTGSQLVLTRTCADRIFSHKVLEEGFPKVGG